MIHSLEQLIDLMRLNGATRIYAKRLASNDNSKNQIYLGGDFSSLNVIPHGEIRTDNSEIAGAVRDRAKASVPFRWIEEAGAYEAPHVGLILYPKYPEVRLSGLLRGCAKAPTHILTVRDEGRVLFLGVTTSGRVLGHAVSADSVIAAEVLAGNWETTGVFFKIPVDKHNRSSGREILLAELRRIHRLGWISSQKLDLHGQKIGYSARNGGGYTLEAELGIMPNGNAEPDFMGWEVKQYGVTDFQSHRPKSPVTLMTPEPTGGIYRSEGVAHFLSRFGYADRSGIPDRINFGGRYDCLTGPHHLTGLRLRLVGYDCEAHMLTDLNGGLVLLDQRDQVAASWSFVAMMAHWNRKHAQAAYVPSIVRSPPTEYHFGGKITLCERTDFLLFLRAMATGHIYYDPAVKVEAVSTPKPTIKRRSQFRVGHSGLIGLYAMHEHVEL